VASPEGSKKLSKGMVFGVLDSKDLSDSKKEMGRFYLKNCLQRTANMVQKINIQTF